MQGNIVSAARWLGGSLVLASVILVVGFRTAPLTGVAPTAAAPAAQVKKVANMNDQVQTLLVESEKLRYIGDDSERFRFLDGRPPRTPSSDKTPPAPAPAAQVKKVADMHHQAESLLTEVEGLRQIGDEWERFWFLDQPSHKTSTRTHGDPGPGKLPD